MFSVIRSQSAAALAPVLPRRTPIPRALVCEACTMGRSLAVCLLWISATAAVAALPSCVRPGAATCADGTLCPDGTACVPRIGEGEGTLCVPPDQVTACDGLVEAATCGDGRRCYPVAAGLVCLDAGCGNGFVDVVPTSSATGPEQCDDGNTVAGDGCAGDCTSTEVCGNGVIDPIHGERCDDSNPLSFDGCSSRCGEEQPTWTALLPPVAQGKFALAYDARRGRVALFAGGSRGPQGVTVPQVDLVEWSTLGWYRPPAPVLRPSPRLDPAMADDVARARMVVFGGESNGTPFGDTWEWDGSTWTLRDVLGPAGRYDAAMAYDAVGRRVVLFGGQGAAGVLSDTWAWNGASWTAVASPSSPPASPVGTRPSLAYDPVTNQLVLATGLEIWILDPAGWRKEGAAPAAGLQLMFDASAGKIVGADVSSQVTLYQHTGATWTAVNTSSLPMSGALVASDPGRGRLVAFGIKSLFGALQSFEWDGTSWVDRTAKVEPDEAASLTQAAAAYDARRGEVVVFGGMLNTTALPGPVASTWAFDGVRWAARTPATSPPARSGAAMGYDEQRDRAVLFGGTDAAGSPLADTWSWDGTTWAASATAGGPASGAGDAIAYDRGRGALVLYDHGTGAAWSWTGTTWTRGPTMPTARAYPAFGYDPVRAQLVMFGGDIDGDALNDTWILDASGWTERTPPTSPPGRERASLTWDAARTRLVLIGGEAREASSVKPRGDAWEWSGTTWQAIPAAPTFRTRHVAVGSFEGGGVTTLLGTADDLITPFGPERLAWGGGATEPSTTRADADGDGQLGCADADSWRVCRPLCVPSDPACPDPAAPPGPHCGDGTCSVLETPQLCPADCGAPPVRCGDFACDPAETATSCPGDCAP